MARRIQIAVLQASAGDDREANVAAAERMIGEAAAAGANVIGLQELFAGPYPCQAEDHRMFDWAEPLPGPTSERIAAAAAEHEVVVVGSFFERRAAGLFHNTAVVFDADGSTAGVYRKMHIPDDPLYYEKFYFTPGDLGFGAFDTRYGRIGVCVCWDQWFPEAARLTALAGAEVIFFPTAIGWLPNEKEEFGAAQHDAWRIMMRSHAIANGVFVAAANRTGREGELEFWGGSFLCDPNGHLLAEAGHEGSKVVRAEVDLDSIDVVRTHWPFLRDRRIDAYGDLTRRWLDSTRAGEQP